jgi:chemotaxis protein CheD
LTVSTPNRERAATGFHAESLAIGEIGTAREAGVLRTFVGSCVGLALIDRRRRLAALAHIMLPDSHACGLPPGKYADTAIPEMLRLLGVLGEGSPLRLAAKITGGAKMFAFQTGTTVGDQNVAAVERILANFDIPVLGRDCGGDRGRRVTLDVASGELRVESLGQPPRIL